MKIIQEYLDIYNEYRSKYKKTALLFQVGNFYQLYTLGRTAGASGSDRPCEGNAGEIARVLNIEFNPCRLVKSSFTRTAGADGAYGTCGFPLVSLPKFLPVLVDNDYTVVVVEEDESSSKNTRKNRSVRHVISQGTSFEHNSRLCNNVMSIYYRKYSRNYFSFGVAVTDALVTKTITVHETHSTPNDKGIALDDLIQMISNLNPIECVIVTRFGDKPDTAALGIKCQIYYFDVEEITDDFGEYGDTIMYALNGLFRYFHDHMLSTVDRQVSVFQPEGRLDMCSTAIQQLDIPMLINNTDINHTLSPMGRRLFIERLTRPLVEQEQLEIGYSFVDYLNGEIVEKIVSLVSWLPDLDKLHQRLSTGSLEKRQMKLLLDVYKNNKISELPLEVTSHTNFPDLAELISALDSLEVETGAEGTVSADRIFKKNVFADIDDRISEMNEHQSVIEKYISKAKIIIPKADFKIQDVTGIRTTVSRAKLLRSKLQWDILEFKNHAVVYDNALVVALCELEDLSCAVSKLEAEYLQKFERDLYVRHRVTLEELSRSIAEMDFYQSAWTMSKRLSLTRPVTTGVKELKAVGLRHLLVESIRPDVCYVSNDISFNTRTIGHIIYGVNSCGKTCFLKSLGMAVVMAQAGLFVAAKSFSYKPFKRVMTRIAGGDNISRSQSSHIMELDELLSILNRANGDTLVIGDEMCRGTDVMSANATVHTTLTCLVSRESFFVTATHLRDLADNPLPKVKTTHMQVTFSSDGCGEPIYTRKLMDGPGPVMYGLEIAKAMNFPADFIEKAMSFRKTETEKRSRYNSKKIVIHCELCGHRPTRKDAKELDTHHVNHQCDADQDGFHSSGHHKNSLHNLVVLCKDCHKQVHSWTKLVKLQTLKNVMVTTL
jgi:DNA mismatch repair protein MutS